MCANLIEVFPKRAEVKGVPTPAALHAVHGHAPRIALLDWNVDALPDFIKANRGLPGNVVHFGDPERKFSFAAQLKDSIIVDDLFESGKKGREPLVIGVYPYKYKEANGAEKTLDVPVIGIGTGMGQASSKIMLWDNLGYVSLNPTYSLGSKNLYTGGRINLIRVGTAGGCNSITYELPLINRPLLVNADANYSSGSVVMESLGWSPAVLGRPKDDRQRVQFEQLWAGFGGSIVEETIKTNFKGGEMEKTWVFLVNQNSGDIVRAIKSSAARNRLECPTGSSISKDSLDLENEGSLIQVLRNNHKVYISEMEQFTANFVANFLRKVGNINAHAGMVVVVVGSLPGTGYPEKGNVQHENEIVRGIDNAMKIALDALGSLALRAQRRFGDKNV